MNNEQRNADSYIHTDNEQAEANRSLTFAYLFIHFFYVEKFIS